MRYNQTLNMIQIMMGECKSGKTNKCVKCSECYTSDDMLYQVNTLRVESASGNSLFTTHPKIEIGCQGSFR